MKKCSASFGIFGKPQLWHPAFLSQILQGSANEVVKFTVLSQTFLHK